MSKNNSGVVSFEVMVNFASTVGRHGDEHTIRNYVKGQGKEYQKLHEDRQLALF